MDTRDGAVRWTAAPSGGGLGFNREGGELVRIEADGTFLHGEAGGAPRRVGVIPVAHAQPAPVGMLAAVTNSRDLTLVDGAGASHLVRCPAEDVLSVLTLRRGGGWAASCSAGTILLGDGAAVVSAVRLTHRGAPLIRVTPVAELPDGRWVVGTLDGRLWQAPAEGGEVRPLGADADEDAADRRTWGGGGVVGLRASPAGAHLLVTAESGPPRIVRVDDGVVVGALPVGTIHAVWQDGETLTAASRTEVTRWRLAERDVAPRRGAAGLASVAFWSAGDGLAYGAGDGTVTVERGADRVVWRSDVGVVKAIAWGTDGVFVGGASVVWHPWSGPEVVVGPELGTRQLAARADGSVVVASWSEHLWRATSSSSAPGEEDGAAAVTSDHAGGRTLLVASDPWLRVLDDGAPRLLVAGPDQGRATLSGDGRRVGAVIGAEARVLDAGDGSVVASFPVSADPSALALDRTGALLLTAGRDGVVSVWRTSDGALVGQQAPHVGRVAALAVSPDDAWAASAGWDGQVVRWSLDVVRLPIGELVAGRR